MLCTAAAVVVKAGLLASRVVALWEVGTSRRREDISSRTTDQNKKSLLSQFLLKIATMLFASSAGQFHPKNNDMN